MHEGYIFCINTGRSGSHYLASLLNTTIECRAYHEAYPNFAGDPIRIINSLGPENTLDLQSIKIQHILRTRIDKPVYSDTSHVFIKSWYLAAVKLLRNIKIIWLRRDHEKIINSFLRLNSIPDKHVHSRNWYLRTDYEYNLIKPENKLSSKQKCEWYVKEIEARALKFKEDFNEIPFFEVWLEELNNIETVFEFFNKLELTRTEDSEILIGKKTNPKNATNRSYAFRLKKRFYRNFYRMYPFRNRRRIHIDGDGIYS